jgi:hypothetical protein
VLEEMDVMGYEGKRHIDMFGNIGDAALGPGQSK